MRDLNRALGDIRDIRRHVAQSSQFRGYGPVTLCATAGIAVAAGFAQSAWASDPAVHLLKYVALWSLTAVCSATLIGIHTLTRTQRLHSGLADEMLRMAVLQFLPALAAGALLTAVVVGSAPASAWMLPGLWQVIYSLGIFASCRFLPRPMLAAGLWFMLSGLFCITLGDARALAPIVMSGAFGLGQLLIATVLYITAKGTSHAEQAS